jgi:hypothetical protein
MSKRAAIPSSLPLLAALFLMLAVTTGCKRAERETPKAVEPVVQEAPLRTREQAMADLLAVPELKAWSEQIAQRSKGKAQGAVIEDDPLPREINGRKYYQLSFVENRTDAVRRRGSFLVAQQGEEILVEDIETDTLLSLQEWRRQIKRVNLKSAD